MVKSLRTEVIILLLLGVIVSITNGEQVLEEKNIDFLFREIEKWSREFPKLEEAISMELQQKRLHGTSQGVLLRVKRDVDLDEPYGARWRCVLRSDFPLYKDWNKYNRLAFWVYVEDSETSNFYLSIYFREKIDTPYGKVDRIQAGANITSGHWEELFLNFDGIPPEKRWLIKHMELYVYVLGSAPMESRYVSVYLDNFRLQKIPSRNTLGWEPDSSVIITNQIGYPLYSDKVGILNVKADRPNDRFTVHSQKSKNIVFEGRLTLREDEALPI